MYKKRRSVYIAQRRSLFVKLLGLALGAGVVPWVNADPTALQELVGGEMVPIPSQLWWSLVLLIIALLLALAVGMALRRKVADRTRRLRESEARLNTILNSVDTCIYIKDRQLRYQYVNKKVCDLFRTSAAEIVGRTDDDFFDEETASAMRQHDLQVLRRGERFANEEVSRDKITGKSRTFFSVKMPLRSPAGQVYSLCGISTDMTEHREVQEQLYQATFFDTLTGLPNRRQLLDRLDHALASSDSTGYEGAVVMVDLDNFKTVNDTLGHEAGDKLLTEVAARLQEGQRATDTIARLAADEFVIILEDLSQDRDKAILGARDLANRCLSVMTQPYELNGESYVLTASLGIAMFSDAETGTEALLKALDLALFAAKSRGRNTVQFFNPAMQDEVNRRTRMEAALRRAIETGELELYLQPQVDTEEQILGMEALLRWSDPELGRVAPGEFIPLAEASGLIVPLGEWVLERACGILHTWKETSELETLTLAVNISPEQFRDGGFVEQIEYYLDRRFINPEQLELEITESLLIDGTDGTITMMQRLAARGIKFALDDFGTGYASLGYLKRLPLHLLKIDQSFIRDLLTDPNDEAIVRTILALGENMELGVLAEGVETAEQAQRLKELGCQLFQGYFYGRPASFGSWESDPRLADAG